MTSQVPKPLRQLPVAASLITPTLAGRIGEVLGEDLQSFREEAPVAHGQLLPIADRVVLAGYDTEGPIFQARIGAGSPPGPASLLASALAELEAAGVALARVTVPFVAAATAKLEMTTDERESLAKRIVEILNKRERPSLPAEHLFAVVRTGLDLTGLPAEGPVMDWLSARIGKFASVIGGNLAEAPRISIAVSDCDVPVDPDAATVDDPLGLAKLSADAPAFVGYYLEPRLIYTQHFYRSSLHDALARRSLHLGIDIFAAAGSDVCTPLDAVVEHVEAREGWLDYGHVVILRHKTDAGDVFYTLYGHLSPAALALKKGQKLAAGDKIGALGDEQTNGGWDPHLHFQMALTTAGLEADWPGVAEPREVALYRALCPNPAPLLNLTMDQGLYPADRAAPSAEPASMARVQSGLCYDPAGRVFVDLTGMFAQRAGKVSALREALSAGPMVPGDLIDALPDALEVDLTSLQPTPQQVRGLVSRLADRRILIAYTSGSAKAVLPLVPSPEANDRDIAYASAVLAEEIELFNRAVTGVR